jgi:hypothetical protein
MQLKKEANIEFILVTTFVSNVSKFTSVNKLNS